MKGVYYVLCFLLGIVTSGLPFPRALAIILIASAMAYCLSRESKSD